MRTSIFPVSRNHERFHLQLFLIALLTSPPIQKCINLQSKLEQFQVKRKCHAKTCSERPLGQKYVSFVSSGPVWSGTASEEFSRLTLITSPLLLQHLGEKTSDK
ncbi:unnamed protein product [Brugia pahangi]|uniref:Secreted protein n=1 Tax=Brugia pahangi TaxID=6280 RepID=A0A0N4TF16_BRUPA|nr:unnamed protein product [Brugia pahangi]